MPKSYDYDSFVAKFNQNAPKTTDDCYTPENVYEALLDYVDSEVTPLDGLHIRRPFYPGGNLLPIVAVRTAPTLVEAIEACNKANRKEAKKDKKQVRTLAYPRNLTSVMLLNKLKAVPLEIKSAECRYIAFKGVYGGGLLITDDAANRIAIAKAKTKAKTKPKAVALTLTPAQEAIVAGLNAAAL